MSDSAVAAVCVAKGQTYTNPVGDTPIHMGDPEPAPGPGGSGAPGTGH